MYFGVCLGLRGVLYFVGGGGDRNPITTIRKMANNIIFGPVSPRTPLHHCCLFTE